ncbi:MAG: branched-chain-amino-acid transaminase [Thermodesulfovibrionales bacterium]
MRIFLDGRLVDEAEALVSVYDHGFLYGDGIYETMRAYEGVVFMLERHLGRLGRSAGLMRLALPPEGVVRDAVLATISANGLADAYVRVTVSRGKGPIGLDPGLCPKPTFVVVAEQFTPYPEAFYRDGVTLTVARTRRNHPDALDPRIKSLNFLNNIFAKVEAKERSAWEAVMLNSAGYLAEGTVSNIFFVRGGVLCTPSVECGVLDGITRETVISAARAEGVAVEEGFFRPEDLFSASEVFFTNTTSEVMPVSRVDDRTYAVGEITRRLHGRYQQAVREYIRTHSP